MRTTGLILWLAGCADGGGPTGASSSETGTVPIVSDCPAGPLSLVPGTGQFAFAPFDVVNGIEMVNGEQGGWHLWTAGQVCNAGPDLALEPMVVEVAGGRSLCGSQPTDQPIYLTMQDNPGAGQYDAASRSGTFYNQLALLDDMFDQLPPGSTTLDVICSLGNKEIDFTVKVTDVDSAESATVTTRLVMHLDPDNVQQCN